MKNKSIYDTGLDRNEANYGPLTPLSFLERTAFTYPNLTSIIHGEKRFSWRETYIRCRMLASALKKVGVGTGDTVAVMATNSPEMYESAFAVPMVGAIINALNIRLDPAMLAFCLEHGEAKVLLTDTEFSETIQKTLKKLKNRIFVININDPQSLNPGKLIGDIEYEQFLQSGDPNFNWKLPRDEWDAISLNYTSGTTGDPKGVVYHHRGAYLNALSNALVWNMGHHPTYLWTLPMFHCNGWCFPWTVAAMGGTNVCLRKVDAAHIFSAISEHKITHFCGAPIVLSMITNAKENEKKPFSHQVNVMTAASPPPASTLRDMQSSGFNVTHVYGLTETYGPAVICAWQPEWDNLSDEQKAIKKSAQGVKYPVLQDLQVMDPSTMKPIPADGKTIGEVMFRGNIVMKGYLKNIKTTKSSLSGGWFHSGDLGVVEPNGYINLKDRSKDIIISGGENISSIEVENILHAHPNVLLAAVVAQIDEKWGEIPCAFIELKDDSEAITEAEILEFCKEHLASFKIPKKVIFGALPKTSTGKIQKFKLRERLG